MIIGFDTETKLITAGLQFPPLACLSMSFADGRSTLVDRANVTRVLGELLDAGHTFVGHDSAFDTLVLVEHDVRLWLPFRRAYEQDRIRCTYVNAMLLDIADLGKVVDGNYNLAAQAQKHLGITLDKGEDTWRLRYGELINVPLAQWPEEAKRYAMLDSLSTVRVDAKQQLRSDRYLRDQYRQARGAVPVRACAGWGVITDGAYVQRYEEQTRTEHARVSNVLRGAGILRPDTWLPRAKRLEPGTINQDALRRRVGDAYRVLGTRPPLTDGGEISYAKDVLRASGDEVLIAQADRASLVKIISEELPILNRGTLEPIHAFYRYLVASGRTGCKKPNLQNRANRYGAREPFIPRAGYAYTQSDFGGLETATLAESCVALFGQSDLADMLRAGIDPHTKFACRILGNLDYEEGCRRKELGANDLIFWRARQVGKVNNFGRPGGLGDGALVDFAWRCFQTRITLQESRETGRAWKQSLREMPRYFAMVDNVTKRTGQMVQIYTDRIRGRSSFTDGCNTLFQGMGADIFKQAMWDVFCEQMDPSSWLYGSHLAFIPHDEIIQETPLSRVHEAALRLAEVMTAAAERFLRHVPLRADKPVAMDRWSKLAKQKRDASDRIRPWTLQDVEDHVWAEMGRQAA